MTPPRRVLAIRLDTIGDVIMTTPALGAIADAGSRVTLLTSTVAGALEPMLPYLEQVVTVDVPWMKHAQEHPVPSASHLRVLERLRDQRFDLAVIFTVWTQDPSCAAYLAYLCGIPVVAGHARGKLYGLLSRPVADSDCEGTARHEVPRQLALTSALGFPATRQSLRLDIPAPSRTVRSLLDRLGSRTWCVLHPGASAPSRRYPAREWARVADLLDGQGVRTVIAGGRQDRARCSEIAALCRREPVRAEGRFSLPEFASFMKAAPVAVTCNSAAAHVAAAAGTPVVTLYAGTNSQHTPWSDRATVLRHATPCAWCYSSVCRHGTPSCIAAVRPEMVVEAALNLLAASAAGPAAEIIDASAAASTRGDRQHATRAM